MRTRVWCLGLVLAALGVACGDQPLEVPIDREEAPSTSLTRAPGWIADATSSSDDGLVISTDKDDYQPGDTVYFTGSGWPANDTLDILLQDEPPSHDPHTWSVPVGEDGTFRDSTYVVDVGDVDVTFTLTATSRSSGRSLAVQFTDANIGNDLGISPVNDTVQRGGFVDYTITVTFGGNATPCTAPLSVSGLSTGTTGVFTPTSVTGSSNDTPKTSTLRITTTATSPLGPDGFTVTAATGAGCTGSNRTVNGTINVFGQATTLAFSQQPTNTAAGAAISPAVTVRVLDGPSGNLVANSTAPITLAISTNPGGGTLSGTVTKNAVNGVATFDNLSINKVANGYRLTASSGGLTSAISNLFNIVLGPPASLVFSTQPSGGTPGTAFPTQPVVQVRDAGGNVITSGTGSTSSITLSITPLTGTTGATLTCTPNNTRAAVAGTATFVGCRINLAGNGYQLRATSGGLTTDSDPIDIAAPNQAPSVDAGTYTVAEGTELTLNPVVNDPDGDLLSYQWTVSTTGIDAGGACTFDDATKKNAKITCTDDSQGGTGGKFSVTLQVNDNHGHIVTDSGDLTVTNVAPVANAGGTYTGNEGAAIQLDGSATDVGANDNGHLSYMWSVTTTGIDAAGTCSFDDATKKNAKITCTDDSNAGTFALSLVASDDDGGTSAASTTTLKVNNVAPTAAAGTDYSGQEGSAIQLNGSANDPGDNDDPHLTYQWTAITTGIDAGGACTFDDATKKNAKVTCTDDGAFQVRLVATDDDGGTSTPSDGTLTVGNAGPVASAGPDYTGVEGSPVQLQGSVTDAGSNDTHTWLWKYVSGTGFDEGGTCSFSPNAAAEDPTVTCTDDGVVQLTLKVTDDDGAASEDQATLTLANAEPVANAGPDYTGSEGTPVQLNGSVTDAGSNDTHTWSWKFVAGSGVDAGATCSFSNATLEDPTITCTDDGVVELTLEVTDDDGDDDDDKALLTLSNVAPVANAGGPYTNGAEGVAYTLAGSATDKGANDVISYKWTADVSALDASAGCSFDNDTKKNAEITCTDDGVVTLTLKATDDDGGFTNNQTTLTLANADPVADAGDDYDGSEGTPVQLDGSVTDAGSNDTHTWSWKYVAGTGVDAGATCSFSNESLEDPTITCTDDGVVELTLTVTDDDGGEGTDQALLTLANVAPVANAGGPYTGGVEGTAFTLAGSATDKGANDQISYKWTANVAGLDNGASCTFDNDTKKNAEITCDDDGDVTLTLKATDDDGGFTNDQTTLTLANADPVPDAGPDYTGSEGTGVKLNGSITDAGANDTHTWTWKYVAGPGVDLGATCSFSDATLDPYITCTDDGVVELTLEVTDDDGGEGADKALLTLANVAPVANAGGPYTDGIEGAAYTLAGSATDKGANDQISYQWTANVSGLDNGASCTFDNDTKKDAQITCDDDGEVALTLKATDDDGGYSTSQTTLTLANADPVADAGNDYTGSEGTGVKLDGSFTDAGGNDTHTWSWKYVAGSGVDAGASCSFSDNSLAPYVTCTDDGEVELTLTVTDDDGGEGVDKALLTLANVAPVAEAGGPYTNGLEGTAYTLAGSATDKGDNDVISYKWTADVSDLNGGGCTFDNDTKKDAKITCTDNGVVTLTLKATDDDGDHTTDQTTLTVANADPVASAGPDYTGSEGTGVKLNGSFTDAGGNDTHTWTWKYVAGTGVDAGATCSFSDATLDPYITCTDDGVVELTLTVTDDDGGEGSDKATLTLSNVAPVANAGGPYTAVAEGGTVNLAGSATDKGANDTRTYKWTLDASGIDGSGTCTIGNDTQAATTVSCNDNGTLKVTLVATDDDGGVSTGSQATITFNNANPAITAFTKADGTALPTTLIVAGTLGLKVSFGDVGLNDTHTLEVDCGTGFKPAAAATSPATGSCTFPAIGSATIKVRVADDDGGSHTLTHTILVKYDFVGFSAPVDRPNTMNVSKAGQAIPLKWTLKNANGAPVTDLATVTVRAVNMACALGTTDDLMEEYAAGASGLQNFGDGRYQFNWKTPTSYASSCKSIELVFAAGGVSYTEGPHAFFSFKK
ncbi:MAG TPA: PKD domain-containing protein [Gemmatimonadales bacterium]